MNTDIGKAIATLAISLAVATTVWITKDGDYLWGLVTIYFIYE